jgi:hypothetical protein
LAQIEKKLILGWDAPCWNHWVHLFCNKLNYFTYGALKYEGGQYGAQESVLLLWANSFRWGMCKV